MAKLEAHVKGVETYAKSIETKLEDTITGLKIADARKMFISTIIVGIFAFLGSSLKEIITFFQH